MSVLLVKAKQPIKEIRQMTDRPEFNELKKEVLGLLGVMEAMTVTNSRQLDAEMRRFTNVVTSRLPKVRKEPIEAYRTTDDTNPATTNQ